MKTALLVIALIGFLLPVEGMAQGHLDFTLHKLESVIPGPTVLIVGGIQGDEPGGFNAAAMLVSHYTIRKGSIWVVPNLNLPSIIKSSRGVHGDLNRKFHLLPVSDPDYYKIAHIKSIILDRQVDLVLNLHDGSGFYRPLAIDERRNPRRWGQSVIIDQEALDIQPLGQLEQIARSVVDQVNLHLYDPEHAYHIKNTNTRLGDREMEKSLTYFAICNGKPAFGLEASKDFPAAMRSYYHLHLIEAFLRRVGVEYERRFSLDTQAVADVSRSGLAMAFFDHRMVFDFSDVRGRLGFVPMKKGGAIEFASSNPLLTVTQAGAEIAVHHGNALLTTLRPQYFDYDISLEGVSMRVDGGEMQNVRFGDMVHVRDGFELQSLPGVRVNVIGYSRSGRPSECGVTIARRDVQERFSVDKSGGVYRVEVYKGLKFAGMVLVSFKPPPELRPASIPRILSLADQTRKQLPAESARTRTVGDYPSR